MRKEVNKIIRDIKSLKTQGARNIAKEVIRALILQVEKSDADSINGLYSELLEVSESLASARPTEPMTRNAIKDAQNFTFMQIRSRKPKSVDELKKAVAGHEKQYLEMMQKNAEKLWDYGSKLVPDGSLVLTHCHSSTVTGVLKRAKDLGKDFIVICFETRPRFQGRITAEELSKHKIETILAVDGAVNMFMKKADMCIVGADAVTSTGDLINKVGTSTLAHISRMHDVSFYAAAELYKYDPLTLYGNREKIEERNTEEVWKKPPKSKYLRIRNPAFDATAGRYINAYITEEGIVSPPSFLSSAERKILR
ncbi:S-methyl-5-thioribose-1-phosphate isomerase [Candidatus Micrarchaeota archaeon]|nr:S-methyl-5-thioribose-1-phosphate isomerase [Candidatus Micrarchaeota archaeon]